MQAIDNRLLRIFVSVGQDVPELLTLARWATELGGSRWLVPLTLVAALFLFLRRQRRRALALISVTAGGRLLVELLKYATDRPRPQLVDYQLVVFSQSFPSSHAANSMIVYVALALIFAPVFARNRWSLPAALLTAFVVGLTRPLLGVHWPSDVLAGWCLGIAWTLGAVWALSRWMEGRPPDRPAHLTR